VQAFSIRAGGCANDACIPAHKQCPSHCPQGAAAAAATWHLKSQQAWLSGAAAAAAARHGVEMISAHLAASLRVAVGWTCHRMALLAIDATDSGPWMLPASLLGSVPSAQQGVGQGGVGRARLNTACSRLCKASLRQQAACGRTKPAVDPVGAPVASRMRVHPAASGLAGRHSTSDSTRQVGSSHMCPV
jgi:hypothetical protein